VADKKLERFSDAEFDVAEVGPFSGPEAAAQRVASFVLGDPPEKQLGADDIDPVAVAKAVRLKAKPRALLYQMEDPEQAQAYAELEHKFLTTGEIEITKTREITDGKTYSLFVCWLEFEKDQEVVKELVENELREKKQALLAKLTEQRKTELSTGPTVGDTLCTANTKRGSPCKAKRKSGEFCGRHAPAPKEAVPMDAPPSSHAPIGVTA
jgi:hypothetical protein